MEELKSKIEQRDNLYREIALLRDSQVEIWKIQFESQLPKWGINCTYYGCDSEIRVAFDSDCESDEFWDFIESQESLFEVMTYGESTLCFHFPYMDEPFYDDETQ